MAWWIWMLLGLGLLGLEMTMPGGFYFLFFGISALIVGGLTGLHLAGPGWMQWLLFSVLAIGALLALRNPFKTRFLNSHRKPVDPVVGEVAVTMEDLAVDGAGQVEFRGSPWTAKNAGQEPIEKGRRCHVDRIQGLTLWVRPE